MNRLHYLIEMSVQMANAFYYGHRILLLFPLQLLLFQGTQRDSVFNKMGSIGWHGVVHKLAKKSLSQPGDTAPGSFIMLMSGCYGSMSIQGPLKGSSPPIASLPHISNLLSECQLPSLVILR